MLRMWCWGPMRHGVYYIEGSVHTWPHNPSMFAWKAPYITIGADVLSQLY